MNELQKTMVASRSSSELGEDEKRMDNIDDASEEDEMSSSDSKDEYYDS